MIFHFVQSLIPLHQHTQMHVIRFAIVNNVRLVLFQRKFHLFSFFRCIKVSCNHYNGYVELQQIMFPASFNAISQHLHIILHHADSYIMNWMELPQNLVLIEHFYLKELGRT